MKAWEEPRRAGLVAAVLARAQAWLLEPPAPGGAESVVPPETPPPRPVVAVRGLARGCGASTVARALATVLARDDPAGASVLAGAAARGGPRLALPAAVRLARSLGELGCDGARAAGRVCLLPEGEPLPVVAARRPCPLVIDVSHSSPPGEALGLADYVVLVGSPEVERSLAVAVESSLARAGHVVDLALTRVEDLDAAAAELPAALLVGESRLAAQVALACREPRGPFAAPIAELAERCRARAPR
jgi:hypothetical protein